MKSHASMNRIYRLVWNAALSLWVAVAENAKGRSKGGSSRSSVDCSSVHQGDGAYLCGGGDDGGNSGFTLQAQCRAALALIVSSALFSTQTHAADAANAAVVAGAGSVATAGNVTTINQATQKLAIDWTSLSTRANEALVFNQPNASAIALNRIIGSSPSEMLGSLTANGQVFILNPNGVLFGAGSQVNVGGLVASTMNLSNSDFEAGNFKFSGSGTGSVINQGTMTAAAGGYLALLAPEVRNEGVMVASLGTALLAAGNKVTLNLDNGSLLGYSIDQGAINALAENKQLIQADGGQVLLSAKAMDSLTTATVNNTGIIEAKTLQNKAGRILLMGDMETGTVNVGGTLDASAAAGDGGFVETSAANVKVAAGTRVTTKAASGKSGTWLIDPVDFTIAAGSAAQDTSGMGADTLSANLDSGNNVSIATSASTAGNGDIFVNSAVSWSADSVLTLTAHRNIKFNATVTATGTNAGLALNYGGDYSFSAPVTLSGSNASLEINGNAYTLIRSMAALDDIDNTGQSGNYALAQDIDASATTYSGALVGGFSGTFAGLGHTISNLNITASAHDVGLFSTNNGSIRDLGLIGSNVSGFNNVGALVGNNYGSITNSYSTGIRSEHIDRGLLLLQDTPGVSSSRATLQPGASVGTSELLIEVNPASPYNGSVVLDNYGSRYTGEYRLGANLNLASPLGRGDQLSFSALTSGSGLSFGRVAYQIPVGSDGLRVGAAYFDTRYKLGKEFAALLANGTARSTSVFAAYPFIRSQMRNLSGTISYEDKNLNDRVDSTATQTGKKIGVTSLGLSGNMQDTLWGGGISSFDLSLVMGKLAIQSPTALTIDSASAQTNGSYNRVGYSLNRLQRLGNATLLAANFSGQFAGKNLDSSEKFSLGGLNGVRAHPQGEASGDEGFKGTVELRRAFTPNVQGTLFYDFGTITKINKSPFGAAAANSRNLSGAGFGMNASFASVQLRGALAWRVDGGLPTSLPASQVRTPTLLLLATFAF